MALALTNPQSVAIDSIALSHVRINIEAGEVILGYVRRANGVDVDGGTVTIKPADLNIAGLKAKLYAALETALGVTGTVS